MVLYNINCMVQTHCCHYPCSQQADRCFQQTKSDKQTVCSLAQHQTAHRQSQQLPGENSQTSSSLSWYIFKQSHCEQRVTIGLICVWWRFKIKGNIAICLPTNHSNFIENQSETGNLGLCPRNLIQNSRDIIAKALTLADNLNNMLCGPL